MCAHTHPNKIYAIMEISLARVVGEPVFTKALPCSSKVTLGKSISLTIFFSFGKIVINGTER